MSKLHENKNILIVGLIFFMSFLLVFFSYVMELIFKENAFQVKQVAIIGEYNQVDLTSLESLLKQYMGAGFFMLNTEQIRQKVSNFPWVQSVKVTRIWPNKLTVKIIQKKVLGRWAKGGYVDEDGQLFVPSRKPIYKPEVEFSGDRSQLIKMVALYNQIFGVFNQYGKKIAAEKLDSFGNATIKTTDGQRYILGSEHYAHTITNFFDNYGVIVKNGPKNKIIEDVDMRYDNGFAIRWTDKEKVGT